MDLDFDNILSDKEIGLFMEEEEKETSRETAKGKEDTVDSKPEEEEETKTTEVNPDDLFDDEGGEEPESVGSSKEEEDKEGATTPKGDGDSPKNFYSSIAKALAVDGAFPNLDDETINNVNDDKDFYNLVEAEVKARLDDTQKRIAKALENNVEPDDIRKYENTLKNLGSISDALISEESERGENIRKNLIYQDFLNKGYSQEKASKFTQRILDAGTDVEDAKEALQSNKEYFQDSYNKLLQEAEKKANEQKAENKKQAEQLKTSILSDKTLMGSNDITEEIRKKAYESISKPVYRDPETGDYLTAVQRYEMEHRSDFLKYTGLFYALTNGFKDFDNLFTKGSAKKEIRKGLKELEQTLNSTKRASDGSLKMVTNSNDDPESFLSGNFKFAPFGK